MGITALTHHMKHPSDSQKSVEARAIYFAVIVFLVSTVVGLVFFGDYVPFFGRGSIGLVASILGTLASFGGYFYVLYQIRPKPKRPTLWQRTHFILTNLALAFMHACIAFLLITIGYFLMQDAFKGLMLDKYAASAMTAGTAGLAAYMSYLIAASISTMLVSTELAVFLVSGAMLSMITADNPQWWQVHLSSLGADNGIAGYAFNATLIVGGAVLMSIADFVANDFAKLQMRSRKYQTAKVNTVRTIMVLVGFFFACVGIFQYDNYLIMHNIAASVMVLLFIGLIAGLPWLVPSFSRAFFGLSYGLVIALLLFSYLFLVPHYLNLTAFEILSFVIIFGWLVIFIRQIAAAQDDQLLQI